MVQGTQVNLWVDTCPTPHNRSSEAKLGGYYTQSSQALLYLSGSLYAATSWANSNTQTAYYSSGCGLSKMATGNFKDQYSNQIQGSTATYTWC